MADPMIYNANNTSIKRIMREIKEMEKDVNPHYTARPLEDNLFEWHFTIRGPPDSPFEKGIYHGRIILPSEYPFKPPNIVLLTPNGRFEVGKKICLSISAYHPESWQPGWSIRTVLVAIIGFMPTKGEGAIGALDYTKEERAALASKSLNWKCQQCGCVNCESLPEETEEDREKIQSQINESQVHIAKDAEKKEENGKQEEDLQLNPSGETVNSISFAPITFSPPREARLPVEQVESVDKVLSEHDKQEREEKIEVREDKEENTINRREKKRLK
eukprot:TRINITY_DN5439_c0_g1_i1.p1 TRINITY_DN5439_c0_g1~~TRINITY_DN5439_c0_g1_i1.p1  ORF type:complete len:303 (+),score=109.17 TRINITY_DN5439_c0_g1_i1:90-911(+)